MPYRHQKAEIKVSTTNVGSEPSKQVADFVQKCQSYSGRSYITETGRATAYRVGTVARECSIDSLVTAEHETNLNTRSCFASRTTTSIVTFGRDGDHPHSKKKRVYIETWSQVLADAISTMFKSHVYIVNDYHFYEWVFFGEPNSTSDAAQLFQILHQTIKYDSSRYQGTEVKDYCLGFAAGLLAMAKHQQLVKQQQPAVEEETNAYSPEVGQRPKTPDTRHVSVNGVVDANASSIGHTSTYQSTVRSVPDAIRDSAKRSAHQNTASTERGFKTEDTLDSILDVEPFHDRAQIATHKAAGILDSVLAWLHWVYTFGNVFDPKASCSTVLKQPAQTSKIPSKDVIGIKFTKDTSAFEGSNSIANNAYPTYVTNHESDLITPQSSSIGPNEVSDIVAVQPSMTTRSTNTTTATKPHQPVLTSQRPASIIPESFSCTECTITPVPIFVSSRERAIDIYNTFYDELKKHLPDNQCRPWVETIRNPEAFRQGRRHAEATGFAVGGI